MKRNLTIGASQRIMIGKFKQSHTIQIILICSSGPQFYKQVVTMSYVGIEDSPLGVKVTIYDPFRCEEKGIFITVEDKFYKKSQTELDSENTLSNG